MSAEKGISGSRFKAWVSAFTFLIAAFFSPTGLAGAGTALPEVVLSTHRASQGDIFYLRVKSGEGDIPRVSWMGRETPLVDLGHGEWCGFLGVDLKSVPKIYPLKVWTTPSAGARVVDVLVEGKDYGERRITLPREKVELDAPTLERVRREAAEMNRVLESPPSMPLWRGSFLSPLQGEVTGLFGRLSIINGEARSPHSGVDLKADLGVPVKAINSGLVVFIADHFFSGRSVVIDHGGGIHSMYFHLDQILVKAQQQVAKGEVIGHVGSTGRSTGPHLHLGVRINGARVDPLRLISLSNEVE